MNQTEYKKMCQRSNVISRVLLEETIRVIRKCDTDIEKKLQAILNSAPIPTPLHHQGHRQDDHFEIDLSDEEKQAVTGFLFDVEASAVSDNGETTLQASRFSVLVDIWNAM